MSLLTLTLLIVVPAQRDSATPENLRCEWKANPQAVRDPCPEFYWEVPSQSAFRVAIAAAPDGFDHPLWETTKKSPLSIVEYAGPRLSNRTTYYWKVGVWSKDGEGVKESAVQTFRLDSRPMPQYLPSARTFVNFAGNPEWAKDKIDLCFRKEAKQGRNGILAVRYALVCTMVVPSKKADDLTAFCRQHGFDLEDCFCHFAADTQVTLHVGAERAENPREKRLCPGWDPRNDRDGDGRVDDDEFETLVNPNATARRRELARIPIYYWGPPRDDYVMNVGNPGYQRYMAEIYAPEMADGYDGIYFDTVPPDVAGVGRNSRVVEYPRQGVEADRWMRDLQWLFAQMKIRLPEKLIAANGWRADPMVIDGFQAENWQRISHQMDRWQQLIDEVRGYDRRGKMQLIQYNPVFHPELAEFGPKVEGVAGDRDRIYGLATYLMAHGDWSYFGFGSHPYQDVTKQWFKAIEHDLGGPAGEYFLLSQTERSTVKGARSLLANGDFERSNDRRKPTEWTLAEPIELDATSSHDGRNSAKIISNSLQINNINKQYVKLKPHTDYTLTVWIKTHQVAGNPGAQVYPYEFEGAKGAGPAISVTGTTDWKRYRQTFTTGDDGEGRINFRIYGATGTAWFDGLELVEGAVYTETVFARQFTKGLVLVRPYAGGDYGDTTSSTVKLPTALRSLNADGTLDERVTRVALRNGEAAILVP